MLQVNNLRGCIKSSAVTCGAEVNPSLCGCTELTCGVPACPATCGAILPFTSAVCYENRWVVFDSAVLNATLSIERHIVFNGNFTMDRYSSARLAINLTSLRSPEPVISISGCASFAGTLQLMGDSTIFDSNLTVATFTGYCGGTITRFREIIVTVPDECDGAVPVDSNYGHNSLTLMIGSRHNPCDLPPNSAIVPGNEAPFPVAALVCGVLAAVLVVTLGAMLLIFVLRRKLVPSIRSSHQLRKMSARRAAACQASSAEEIPTPRPNI
jgi:hypothetical protein